MFYAPSGVVQYLETGEGDEDQLAALQNTKCTQETIRVLYAGMYKVLSMALRTPSLKPEVLSY